MKIELKEDLENEKLRLSVTVERRKWTSQKIETFYWADAEKYITENYTVPKGYILTPLVKNHKVESDYADRLHRVWEFDLKKNPVAKAIPAKKTQSKTKKASVKTKSEA
tara:strand:+ start:1369 stop:1695 length:327 start_codon:yes stop_codon:yes gene_type:complete